MLDIEVENNKKKVMEWELKAESRMLIELEIQEWMEARRKWMEKEREKTTMLKQKVRIKWDVEGDENTFHSTILGGN